MGKFHTSRKKIQLLWFLISTVFKQFMGGTPSQAKKDDLNLSEDEEENVPPLPKLRDRSRNKESNKYSFKLYKKPEHNLSGNKNYGVIPLIVVHNIMKFLRLPDLYSMMLTCKLFEKACNNNFFWGSYFNNYFPGGIEEKNVKNWKKRFFEQTQDPNDEYYGRKFKRVETPETPKYFCKFTLLGPENSGKSTFLKRLVDGEFIEREITGGEFEDKFFQPGTHFWTMSEEYVTNNKKNPREVISIDFWDKNRDIRDRYRSTDPRYFYRGSCGVFIFFGADSTTEDFKKTKSWVKEAMRHIFYKDPAVVLVRSKIDIFFEEEKEEDEWKGNIDREEVEWLVEENDILFVQISSKENINIKKAMGMLLDDYIKKKNDEGKKKKQK